MPDAMDAVQTFNEEHTADALQRHAQRKVLRGRSHCANLDCDEPISTARQEMGAQLCLGCQREVEARDAHIARWKQR